jgi:hypothetical protein
MKALFVSLKFDFYADAYTEMLWKKNIVRSLKSTTEVVLQNMAEI